MRPFLVGAVLALSLCHSRIVAQGMPASAGPANVPVKSVVLFSSGVGYFEHLGTVRGDGSTELRFKAAQINDILKSLVLQDQDGGHVSTITYPSQDPIAKTLRSFEVDITSNPGMASLLNQLRGARVSVQLAGDKATGTILGVESRTRANDKGEGVTTSTLNLINGPTIRSIELSAVQSLTLDDSQLEAELTKALSALGQARDQDKKPVTINFNGSGERRVRIGYVVETPIWKTSYRLLLDDKKGNLQGWAIVENQTESDWNNVSLSLISGRPISFIMDLYQPLYLQRPTVVSQLYAALQPPLYGAGSGGRGGAPAPVALEDLVSTETHKDALVPRDQVSSRGGRVDLPMAGGSALTVQTVARTTQLGELFQYNIPNVPLARQKSAMLPIVTDTVGVQRVSIYNAMVLPRNPLNGVRLKNTTGKHLQQGPVTVIEKNVYAGDARIDDVRPGQDRLLSYGIDLDVLVDDTKNAQSSLVTSAKIVKGAMIVERKYISSMDYQINNTSTHEKTIVIEHPARNGWKLAEAMKPTETTPGLYRFQTTVAAGQAGVYTVKEESAREETVMLLPTDPATLLAYSRNGELSQPVRDALVKAMQMRQSVVDLDRQIAAHTMQISDITEEQARIRENMKSVEPKSQYSLRLLTKLNEQESSIERLQRERDALQTKRDIEQKALEQYVGSLTLG